MSRFGSWKTRWPAIALVASLVLNGFLIGLAVTDTLRPRHHGPNVPRPFGYELRRLGDRLPPEAVEQMAPELEAAAPALQARFDALRALRNEVSRMAAEPTPDRTAIDAQLEALRTESLALQADIQKATYDALLKLPPNMRAGLARPKDGS